MNLYLEKGKHLLRKRGQRQVFRVKLRKMRNRERLKNAEYSNVLVTDT